MPDARPVILIGAARSGTKFLRDVLGSGAGTASVPFDVNYVWRYGNEDAPDDALDPACLTEAQVAFVRRVLPQIARARAGDILVEKTVSNTLRVPMVDRVFPNARFVHLVRDGREVTESAMRQWQAPPNWSALAQKLRRMPLRNVGYAWWFGKNYITGLPSGRSGGRVWGPRYPGIGTDLETCDLAEICARQWLVSVSTSTADLSAIAPDRVFRITYGEMTGSDRRLRELVEWLELPDPKSVINAFRERLRPGSLDGWDALPDETRKRILSVIMPEMEKQGLLAA